MLIEEALRRSAFLAGVPIRLADGQCWTFPGPGGGGPPGSGPRSDPIAAALSADACYLELLGAVVEAEDRAELLRAELALAIHLLGWNYDLDPDDYRRLLEFEPDDRELGRVQREFHELARTHLGRHRRGPEAVVQRYGLGKVGRLLAGLGDLAGIRRVPGSQAGLADSRRMLRAGIRSRRLKSGRGPASSAPAAPPGSRQLAE